MGNDIISKVNDFDKLMNIYKKLLKEPEYTLLNFSYTLRKLLNLTLEYKYTIFLNEIIELFLNYIIVNKYYFLDPEVDPIRENLYLNLKDLYISNYIRSDTIEHLLPKVQILI